MRSHFQCDPMNRPLIFCLCFNDTQFQMLTCDLLFVVPHRFDVRSAQPSDSFLEFPHSIGNRELWTNFIWFDISGGRAKIILLFLFATRTLRFSDWWWKQNTRRNRNRNRPERVNNQAVNNFEEMFKVANCVRIWTIDWVLGDDFNAIRLLINVGLWAASHRIASLNGMS